MPPVRNAQRHSVWVRGIAAGVLLGLGWALLRAAPNDGWSATVGLLLGQGAIGAGAWVAARPLLAAGVRAVLGQRLGTALPPLIIAGYTLLLTLGVADAGERRFVLAAAMTLPGPLLDALLVWHAGHERASPDPSIIDQERAHC